MGCGFVQVCLYSNQHCTLVAHYHCVLLEEAVTDILSLSMSLSVCVRIKPFSFKSNWYS